jgi:hypothetical protein
MRRSIPSDGRFGGSALRARTALAGAALAAAALGCAACGRRDDAGGREESAAARPASPALDPDVQRACVLEDAARRLDAQADERLRAGDRAYAAGEVSAAREDYIEAGRLYESAAEQRRQAADVAAGIRARWNEDVRRRRTPDESGAPR